MRVLLFIVCFVVFSPIFAIEEPVLPTAHAARESNVKIYRYRDDYVFYFLGRTAEDKPFNAALWFPEHPNRLFISTTTHKFETMLGLYEQHEKLLEKGYPRQISKHFLLSDNDTESYTELLGVSDGRGIAEFFEADFNGSLASMLSNNKLFLVNLGTKDPKKPLKTFFNIQEFKTIYQAYVSGQKTPSA